NGKVIYHLPKFRPDDVSADDEFNVLNYFRQKASAGLNEKLKNTVFENGHTAPEYTARLEYELAMIESTGFTDYFMIVADFVNWAKHNGVPVGPGRGSGAGSLVAYALGITDIDPIQFDLLFERFINPERISMPDFDIDFCQDRRADVINYVAKKYGSENVSQIITFGKLQARAVIKDVGRVHGLSFSETDALTKLLPDQLNISLDEAIEAEPRLRERMESDPHILKIMSYARKLEGLCRNAGIHAAGVIITEQPVVTYCPMYVGKDGAVVTQFDKDFAEAIGLIKFDFLGLKTLTVIDNAVKLIRQAATGTGDAAAAEFSLQKINYRDPAVFALVSSGDTDGVFQVESSGMKDLCKRIQPSSIEDLTAINALYRPGPLGSGMVDDFVDRKHGRMPIKYETEALEPLLKDTYGVILYQEQVMQIARELAGYSLGQADLLRRAMGKKKPEEMAKHREIFIKGATEKGLGLSKAQGIFELMAKFAEYGFNKSHSAAYAVLTYQTAYLKAHFAAEFMAALMTTEMDNTDKLTKYIADARQHHLPILSPDINNSQRRFSVELLDGASSGLVTKGVRFGLEAIKGVGGAAVDAILEARSESRFKNVLDFCRRVSNRKANKKVLESLTLSGAFDGVAEVNRASLFSSLESVLEGTADEQHEKELGQASLFDAFSEDEVKLLKPVANMFKEVEDWPIAKKLAQEKQVVGFYVSGHPMDPWQKICDEWLGWNTDGVKAYAEQKSAKKEIKIGGLICDIKEITTKKGTRMAFAQLEDLIGKIDVVFFPDVFSMVQEFLKSSAEEANPVLLEGEIETGGEVVKILAKGLRSLSAAQKERVSEVIIRLHTSATVVGQLRELKGRLLEHRGKSRVRIEFMDDAFVTYIKLPATMSVQISHAMISSVNKIFGSDVVSLC
ncbi:MAG: DNA polymerase III subunit alpha, partial [Bdellovibrionota bacterium]